MIPKIAIRHAKELGESEHSAYKTRVTVQFKDGVIERRIVDTPLGGDEMPLSNAAAITKFNDLVSNVTETTEATRLESFILPIEQQRTLEPLLSLLCSISMPSGGSAISGRRRETNAREASSPAVTPAALMMLPSTTPKNRQIAQRAVLLSPAMQSHVRRTEDPPRWI